MHFLFIQFYKILRIIRSRDYVLWLSICLFEIL